MHCSRITPFWLSAALFSISYHAATAAPLRFYVTGELGASDVIFKVDADPALPGSGTVSTAYTETRGLALDGIDYVPGTSNHEVVVGVPTGKITHYDVVAGTMLPDYIALTDAISPGAPPPAPGSHPSSVLSTPTHFYYIENQFGFGTTTDHRIVRGSFTGAPEELVFDAAAAGLVNLEGVEIVPTLGGLRLFTFAADPGHAGMRALVSIGLGPGGLWDGMAPSIDIPGLSGATDGSDELDFDPGSGLLFGTNIVTGEVIAWDPLTGMPVTSPGAMPGYFIDPAQVAAGLPGGLALLKGDVDGIRADGAGHLVFTGRAGVIGAIDIGGVLSNGADNTDVYPLFVSPSYIFDDLTPLVVPEPSSLVLAGLAVLSLAAVWRRHAKSRR